MFNLLTSGLSDILAARVGILFQSSCLVSLRPIMDLRMKDKLTQCLLRERREIPALTAAVLTLPAGRSLAHGQLLLHLLVLGLLVDLIDSLGAGVFSPLDPVILT